MDLINLNIWQVLEENIVQIATIIGAITTIFGAAVWLLSKIYPKERDYPNKSKLRKAQIISVVLLVFLIVVLVVAYNLHYEVSTKDLVLPIDTMEDTCYGTLHNVEYTNGKDGRCILLKREKEGAINYPLVSEGTIRFSIKVLSGYRIHNKQADISLQKASVYTTVGYDSWYPGAMSLYLESNGDISFMTATSYRKNNGEMQMLIAAKSDFRFNQWHDVGISFGSEGQQIYLDGNVLTTDENYKQPLAVGGDIVKPCDRPTFGYFHSCCRDSADSWDIGFEGFIDNVKISRKQSDW